jgi:hypothetical protein
MHNKASLGLALAIAALSGWAIFSALEWPWKAKLFPMVIGIPLLCLALAEVLWVVFGSSAGAKAADFKLTQDQPPEVVRRRTLVATGWIGGFFAAIMLLGFPIAVPLLVVAYLRFEGKESWLFSGAFALMVWGAFYGLFERLLHLPFPPGWLLEWLGLA